MVCAAAFRQIGSISGGLLPTRLVFAHDDVSFSLNSNKFGLQRGNLRFKSRPLARYFLFLLQSREVSLHSRSLLLAFLIYARRTGEYASPPAVRRNKREALGRDDKFAAAGFQDVDATIAFAVQFDVSQ